jgi:hypothetical protein
MAAFHRALSTRNGHSQRQRERGLRRRHRQTGQHGLARAPIHRLPIAQEHRNVGGHPSSYGTSGPATRCRLERCTTSSHTSGSRRRFVTRHGVAEDSHQPPAEGLTGPVSSRSARRGRHAQLTTWKRGVGRFRHGSGPASGSPRRPSAGESTPPCAAIGASAGERSAFDTRRTPRPAETPRAARWPAKHLLHRPSTGRDGVSQAMLLTSPRSSAGHPGIMQPVADGQCSNPYDR